MNDSAHPAVSPPISPPATPPPLPRLGEELPVFCEQCGYSLHGLPPVRCDHCSVLHLRCPECGHAQPINTLRPAFQRILGRIRAAALVLWVFFKINYFLWLLIAWGAMGMEWSYRGNWQSVPVTQNTVGPGGVMTSRTSFQSTVTYVQRPLDLESAVAFCLFALSFGAVSRMLLLRWRRGVAVGSVLAWLVVAAVSVGAILRYYDLTSPARVAQRTDLPGPFGEDFRLILGITAAAVFLGAVAVWPIWYVLVRLFLPQRTAKALLEWQYGLSGSVSHLGRE